MGKVILVPNWFYLFFAGTVTFVVKQQNADVDDEDLNNMMAHILGKVVQHGHILLHQPMILSMSKYMWFKIVY